jgi:hypothetical protein
MAILKHNNNSISNVTSFALVPSGSPVLLATSTASGSSSISFTTGIDSTYDIYKFEFSNVQPATDAVKAKFNFSTDGGSNYNVTKTCTGFYAGHTEADATGGPAFDSGLAQSTSDGFLTAGAIGSDADESMNGTFFLFNPSSTTYVKHYTSDTNMYGSNPQSQRFFSAGYGNTTSAINAIIFRFESGNIASGTIKMYGIKGN